MASSQMRIAIVGAGPGGLTLAALLHKKSIPFTLFELRAKPNQAEVEKPSGSLDLHEGTGLTAIRELGLYDKFSTLTGDCTQVMKIADKAGRVLHADEGEDEVAGENRPEIARNKLTELLLSVVPPDSVKWEHKLLSATPSGSARVELNLGANGQQTFDLVIGADGAWSKVRTLLTDFKPKFAGQHFITASIRNITTKYPHLAEFVGSGTSMVLGDRHGVISQRAANDTARLYTLIKTDDDKVAESFGLDAMTASQVKTMLLDGPSAPLRNFGPIIKELITAACDDEEKANPGEPLEHRPLYTLDGAPNGFSWPRRGGATLLGDAAHLMPPNGEGVNTAMRDALELSQVIGKACKQFSNGSYSLQEILEPLLSEYETDATQRAEEVAEETRGLLEAMYGADDGAEAMVKMFKEMMAGMGQEEHMIRPMDS
ncbi:FAD binding domain-containing protein [Sarocladium implicatum]|nr:FAD binding domain-containing protein [Sarocladium implicatum]